MAKWVIFSCEEDTLKVGTFWRLSCESIQEWEREGVQSRLTPRYTKCPPTFSKILTSYITNSFYQMGQLFNCMEILRTPDWSHHSLTMRMYKNKRSTPMSIPKNYILYNPQTEGCKLLSVHSLGALDSVEHPLALLERILEPIDLLAFGLLIRIHKRTCQHGVNTAFLSFPHHR